MMKRLIFVMLSLVLQSVQAQKNGDLQLGFSAGLNISSVSNPDIETNQNVDSKKGLNAGVSAEYFILNHWSLKGKLIYDQKGLQGNYFRKPIDQASGYVFREYNSDFEMNYLTVPISLQWHFVEKVDFGIGVGGYAGLLLESNDTEHQFFGNRRQFSKTDFGAIGSLTIKYPLTNNFKIGFEYEFQQGFSDLYSPNNTSDKHLNSRQSFNICCFYSI